MYRVFVVEDDPVIAGAVCAQMESWGLEARCAGDFGAVMAEFAAFDPQLVLLDISLPRFSGYHWCAELRKRGKVPILFLSSAGDEMNLVMAINLGADDFVAKPFSMEVLTAKIRALLRRSYDFGSDASVLRCGGVSLRLGDGVAAYGGKTAELTKNEAQILQQLLESPGRTVRRETLIRALWEREDFIDDNTLTVNVTRLRKKLEAIGLEDFIVTRKGEGYLCRVSL